MTTIPAYIPNVVENPGIYFSHFWDNLPWEQRDAPRLECFFSDRGEPYTYGEGRGMRTYIPHPEWDVMAKNVQQLAEAQFGVAFEACFINGYEDHRQHLGWHADDSDRIDHSKPILVYSFGAEREIWVMDSEKDVSKFLLGNGSVFVMPAGMQQTHLHRIPKHSAACGPRISLTFRALI